MIVNDVIKLLDQLSPLSYAEDFDNVGLLVGDLQMNVSGILVTLDTLEDVVDEAIENNCNLIVSFHPIIFRGLKNFTGKTYVERVVMKAIKNDIAIFAIHTALDNALQGVNAMICKKLNVKNPKILIPQPKTVKKLTTFVPVNEADKLREALFNAGAGNIGNYSNCSFNTNGIGTYKGNLDSNPTVGKIGVTQFEKETQISCIFPKHLETKILQTLFKTHSYEEVAYEVKTIDNTNQDIGMGMIGEIEEEISETAFLKMVKEKMKTPCIRYSKFRNKNVKKVAVLGGSGSFAIGAAKAANADVFITSDLKYHDFFTAENNILLADIGHYESEQYTKNLIVSYLTKKIPNFAIILSKTNTNPVKYL
ncbi:MAG: Nif3-like dinuclear metal center hexameric protein [Flavobacteriaceae bacterium]|nr:Nif3-like dinuclear metal center hexameric protein [Flavobacteriaceae bacterium]